MFGKAGFAVSGFCMLTVLAGAMAAGIAPARADAVDQANYCFVYTRSGENDKAIDACTKAISSGDLQDADLVSALINRGVAYKAEGKLDQAIDDYTHALKLTPEDALVLSNRANAYLEKGNLDAAQADIAKSLKINPESASAWYVSGRIKDAKGEPDARKDYIQALGLDPDNKDYQAKVAGK